MTLKGLALWSSFDFIRGALEALVMKHSLFMELLKNNIFIDVDMNIFIQSCIVVLVFFAMHIERLLAILCLWSRNKILFNLTLVINE